MWQVVFAYVLIEGWIVDPDEHRFFYQPREILLFPAHYTEVIVGREEQNLSRLIKESMFIRVNNPSLNKNIGKYHLPHIWDEVLINNKELKLK